MAVSTGVIVDNPNSQTVLFAGQFINLSAISRHQDIDISYLSRIFRGERIPSVRILKKIGTELGYSIDQMLTLLENVGKS